MKYQGITIFKRKSCNTWYARYRHSGKQFCVSAKTQLECYNKLKKELKQITKNKSKTTDKPTFIQWFNKWLELFKKDVKEITKKDYKYSLDYIKPLFNKQLDKITSIEILELLNKITFERRKQKVYELLNDIFNKATINEIISKNPINKIDKPKHKKINGQAISNEDEQSFEKLLIQENLDCFLICLYQGLRKGEMLALTNDDIDLNNKTLNINKAINEQNELDTTKNSYSIRIMPLFDNTIKILEKYKNKKGRIFDITYKQSSRIFDKFIKTNFNGKKYTAHSLRHTFITRCQENNIPLHIIQKWVGHSKGSLITGLVYTHAREKAEQKYTEIFNQNSTQQ